MMLSAPRTRKPPADDREALVGPYVHRSAFWICCAVGFVVAFNGAGLIAWTVRWLPLRDTKYRMPPELSAAVESTFAGAVENVHLMWPSSASRAYRPP